MCVNACGGRNCSRSFFHPPASAGADREVDQSLVKGRGVPSGHAHRLGVQLVSLALAPPPLDLGLRWAGKRGSRWLSRQQQLSLPAHLTAAPMPCAAARLGVPALKGQPTPAVPRPADPARTWRMRSRRRPASRRAALPMASSQSNCSERSACTEAQDSNSCTSACNGGVGGVRVGGRGGRQGGRQAGRGGRTRSGCQPPRPARSLGRCACAELHPPSPCTSPDSDCALQPLYSSPSQGPHLVLAVGQSGGAEAAQHRGVCLLLFR